MRESPSAASDPTPTRSSSAPASQASAMNRASFASHEPPKATKPDVASSPATSTGTAIRPSGTANAANAAVSLAPCPSSGRSTTGKSSTGQSLTPAASASTPDAQTLRPRIASHSAPSTKGITNASICAELNSSLTTSGFHQ